MIQSMTAFSCKEVTEEWGYAAWELRSVNNRYLDVNTRLPEDFRTLEPAIKERVAKFLSRGKVDCSLRYQPAVGDASELTVNLPLARQLIAVAAQLDELLTESLPISTMDVMRWPGVVVTIAPDSELVGKAILKLLDESLKDLVHTRSREGNSINELITTRVAEIQSITTEVRGALPEIQLAARQRLEERLADFSENLDSDRVEQEMVILANKMDVAEELDRLETHVAEVNRVLERNEPVGRRLDFLMQELNREANTLGSKSIDTLTTKASVDLKVLIEQMREQIQNIE